MPTRRTASIKQLKPDPNYQSLLASKFINCLMWDGKKATAQLVFYRALEEIGRKGPEGVSPIDVFNLALENCKPQIEVRSKRVGGATYQVPMQVHRARQQTLAIRWVIGSARDKKGRPMHLRLAEELLAAYRREGAAMEKREGVHRMAEANKAFSHFAW